MASSLRGRNLSRRRLQSRSSGAVPDSALGIDSTSSPGKTSAQQAWIWPAQIFAWAGPVHDRPCRFKILDSFNVEEPKGASVMSKTSTKQPGDLLMAFRANLLLPTTMLMILGGIGFFFGGNDYARTFGIAIAYWGIVLFSLLGFGQGTLCYMREARAHLNESNEFPPKFQRRAAKWYCYRAGVRAVARQMGMEETLIPKIRDWRTPTLAARPLPTLN